MNQSHPNSDPVVLPDTAALARLVSEVTGPMCGTTFTPAADHVRGQSICGRMFLLPIPGERDIRIVLSSDAAGCEALGAAMFGRPRDQLTRDMTDDALRELLNMVGGQIQTFLRIDQQLGLPRPTNMAELATMGGAGLLDAQLLTSNGTGDIKMWIFETTGNEKERGAPAGGLVRSLFRKLTSA